MAKTEPFEQQIKGASKTALIKILQENFGYSADSKLTKEKLQEVILDLHRKSVAESQAKTARATKKFEKSGEPVVSVLFQHLDGDRELKFSYDCGKGTLISSTTGRPLPTPTFHLMHNQLYELPLAVVDWLNSREVPDVRVVPGPDGQITNEPVMRKRFSCEIRLTAEQRKLIAGAA